MHLNDMSDPAFKKVDVPFKNDAYVLYDVHITNDPAFKTIDSLYSSAFEAGATYLPRLSH